MKAATDRVSPEPAAARDVNSMPCWSGWRPAWRIDPFDVAGVLLLIVVWELLTLVAPVAVLPSPQDVVRRIAADFWAAPELSFYGLDTGFAGSLLYTATNVLIAIVAGSLCGVLGGLLTARVTLLRQLGDPVMMTAGTIPVLVLAPFFLIWFGVGRASAVLLVVFYVTVMLYIFAQKAVSNLPPIYEEAARTLGASRLRILRDVVLPGTLPEILGGIRIALAGAWGLEAITELLGAQSGMGKLIQVLAGATDVQGIFAALVTLGFAAIVCDGLAALLVGRATTWTAPNRPAA